MVTALQSAHQEMVTAFDRATRLKSLVLPDGDKSFATADKAYQLGKLSYLEVLDAQRTLFDAQESYIDALASYHTAKALAERLLGKGLVSLATLKNNPSEE